MRLSVTDVKIRCQIKVNKSTHLLPRDILPLHHLHKDVKEFKPCQRGARKQDMTSLRQDADPYPVGAGLALHACLDTRTRSDRPLNPLPSTLSHFPTVTSLYASTYSQSMPYSHPPTTTISPLLLPPTLFYSPVQC